MERRAEERQRVRQERRERHRQQEEQRLLEKQAVEEAERRQREEEERQNVLERRYRERAEQRKRAEQLVDLALQREKARKARCFWVMHRLFAGWCGLRHVVIRMAKVQQGAWRHHLLYIQRSCFIAWKRRSMWISISETTCHQACLRMAVQLQRRHAFHMVLWALELLGQHERENSAVARYTIVCGVARRCICAWNSLKIEIHSWKLSRARQQHMRGLSRWALGMWVLACEQSRLDTAVEMQTNLLQQKVQMWLHELTL